MQWIVITTGLAVLLAAALLTWLHRRMKPAAKPDAAPRVSYRRAKVPAQLLTLLQRAVRSGKDTQDVSALIESAHPLMEHILRLRTLLRTSPALPQSNDGEPRLMDLAREVADAGRFTVEALIDALGGWQHVATPAEVSTFPLCIASAQCQRLMLLLRSMLADAKVRLTAAKLALHLAKSKQPYALLEKASLNPLGLAELVKILRKNEQEAALASVESWLSVHDIPIEDLAAQDAQRQVQLAEEIRRAVTCFDALERMDWLSQCEPADALHQLLQDDPSDIYPRMDARSRLQLRHQVESLARRVRLDTSELVRQALLLCQDAEPRSLERCVGYWFQDAEGMLALHRSLPTRKGRLYARFSLRRASIRYGLLWITGGLAGFAFLHSGEPVFMLPFFALVFGCVSRYLIRRINADILPCMELSRLPEPVKALVVLPATLHDTHEAIRMVRRLKTARQAFPADGVDYLLLGDFAPGMTAVSSSDAAIIKAATAALAAIQDEAHIFYLQRGRTWDGDRHTYAAQGGRRGAVSEICRLIAQGECEGVVAFATLEPAQLERKYDYVLVLPEDRQVYPGMFERLLKTMTHPLCSRYPTGSGWRGFSVLSPESSPVFEGIGLIRPDAYLEATDGLVDPSLDADALCGELAGHTSVPGASVQRIQNQPSWDDLSAASSKAWRLAPWQLPWVKTPAGVLNNPLGHAGRFHLREGLRSTLIPLGQFGLLLWAVLTQNWPLLLIALLAPEVGLSLRWEEIVHACCRLSLLPMRMVVNLQAILPLLRRRPSKAPAWPSLEVWAQGLGATLFAALAVLIPGFALPALGLTVVFACFPLAHRWLEAPVRPAEGLTNEHVALLEDAASSTWKFFTAHVSAETGHLPPYSVQYEPELPVEQVTSPEAIGAWLLSCVCAKELGYVSASDAASHIARSVSSLRALPMPYGLPCRRYALPSLTVLDAQTDAASTGFFIAALMTTAQALRTWLPELPVRYASLSAEIEGILSSFDPAALYDPQAGLFRQGIDENGQPHGYVSCFADEALLLSIAACARRQIPPEHFIHLSRTCVRLDKKDVPLSSSGGAAAHLLAGLFVPLEDGPAQRFIHAMSANAQDGLFGQGESACWGFDPSLHYQRAAFGLTAAALHPASAAPVYAPYAAALCLPFAPRQAADALSRFYALGAKGPEGFCDSIDLTQGTAIVGLHDAFHQGLFLAAAAHVLADAPVGRYFCALPEVEACLPLLESRNAPSVLPALPAKARKLESLAPVEHAANPLSDPAQGCVLGNHTFRLIADTRGQSSMQDGDIPLTRHSTKDPVHGLQFYLADEGRIYRLGSPLLQSQVVFGPGEARYEAVCGSLRAELSCFVDTLRRRAIHMVTVTNLSTRDRLIELADFLQPDLSAPRATLETSHPEKGRLSVHARGTEYTLHHTMDASIPALAAGVCTDALAFIGRGRTLHEPASLEEPLHDLLTASPDPCLSFRARYSLGGRGQLTAWFTTSLLDSPPPQLTELPGIRRLASMQHAAIAASVCLTEQQMHSAQRLIIPLQEAGQKLSLHLDSTWHEDTLSDLSAILCWFRMHGMETKLCIVCPEALHQPISEALDGRLSEVQLSIIRSEAFDPAEYALQLSGELPLTDQLDAMTSRLALPATNPQRPVPAQLPQDELLHPSLYGGFDPETLDYVIQLEPGQTTPALWTNPHKSRYFQEIAAESGFCAPFHESVWIQTDGGTLLSPWSTELPRSVRMRPGETDWEAWTDQLDVRLRAACLPGHRCGLRSLHLHNATDQPITLQISVLARLADGSAQLECAPGVVMTNTAKKRLHAYLAGDGWASRRIHAHALQSVTDQPALHEPDEPAGETALLDRTLTLEPHRSGKVVWIAGFARHAEDVARAIADIQNQSISALLRTAQTPWTQRLSTLTISTPEDTLDLLVNRILPMQTLTAEGLEGAAALIYLVPMEAKRALLRAARDASSRDDWAHLALLLSEYVRVTVDSGIWEVSVSSHEDSLFQCCAEALTQTPLDRHGLPLGDDQPRRCFLYVLAAKALDRLRPTTELEEFSRKLLNVADTYLWQEGYYGEPLQLDVQSLACAAYGANPRTRQAISTCWTTLYDQLHGLIRRQMPDADAPLLPGLPENGGMVTLDAVHCLRALLRTEHREHAFELLRALNPIHHTDDPLRMETFRGAPYQLHGGMCASPLEAGRAVPDGGDEAAAWLYAVVLHDVLGFHREGNRIHLSPNVPADWEDYALTLHEGASTWHISVERRIKTLTIDGEESDGSEFTVVDDSKVHQVRFPLK